MASLTPQQPHPRVPLSNAIPQQQQTQPQLQYASQVSPSPVATLQQPQVVRSPTLSRKPVGQRAVIPSNSAPSPLAQPNSGTPAPLAQQQHAQQHQRTQTNPNAQFQPTQQLQAPVVQHPAQTQHQPLQQQQAQFAQRPQLQALQQPQQAQATQHSQSAGAVLTSHHVQQHYVQQIAEAKPPLPRRITVPSLQPQQGPHPQSQQTQHQQSGNRVPVQVPRPNSTASPRPPSVSSGPSIMTPSTGLTTPGTPNTTNSQWQQAQPPNNTARFVQQQHGTSTIFCNHCKTGIPSNVSTYTCLICSTANVLTSFCVWCFTSGAAATSHPHDKAYYVNDSDMRVQLAPSSGVPAHLWTVKRNVTGTFWYTHNASGYKTHVKPHVSVAGSAGLPPGWAERRTPDGRTFFFNSMTGATSWVRPVNSLPPGWRELRTPDLVPFYVHDGMALSSWERPGQQPKGKRSSMMGRPGASNAGDSLKKLWGKLGKTQNLHMMARLATTVNNMSDGNVQPEEGYADGCLGDASMEGESVGESGGGWFGGETQQQDVQTEAYADNEAFQQVNFTGQQEQPAFTAPSDGIQQPIYEQPNEQLTDVQSPYQQPLYDQASIAYQQPTYETDQQAPVIEGLAQSPLTNDTSYVLQEPQPEANQLYVSQEPFGVTPEQEAMMQSQGLYTSPTPGVLENPYQTAIQQEVLLNQPTASVAQSQALLMQQILASTGTTEQPVFAVSPEDQLQISTQIAQEQQQSIMNNEVTLTEAETDVMNNTAQAIDNSQLDVANAIQASLEQNIMANSGQYDSVNNDQEVLIDNAQLNTMNELQSVIQTNIVASAESLPGPVIIDLAQIQGETVSAASCDISSLSTGVQAINITAQDAVSRPTVAAEPTANPSLEQKGAEYSLALI